MLEPASRLFVHLPKCAGTSVLEFLKTSCAHELSLDYGDSFMRLPWPERGRRLFESMMNPTRVPPGKLVYGHFFPIKYVGSRASAFEQRHERLVTIMRDPIDRLRSHYEFWRASPSPDHYLWNKMKVENWTFSDFAFSAEMKNFYSQYFFQIPIGAFSYIGLFERLEPSIRGCLHALGVEYPRGAVIPEMNRSVSLGTDVSATMRKDLVSHHAEDYVLYEYARAAFHGLE